MSEGCHVRTSRTVDDVYTESVSRHCYILSPSAVSLTVVWQNHADSREGSSTCSPFLFSGHAKQRRKVHVTAAVTPCVCSPSYLLTYDSFPPAAYSDQRCLMAFNKEFQQKIEGEMSRRRKCNEARMKDSLPCCSTGPDTIPDPRDRRDSLIQLIFNLRWLAL